MLTKEKARTIAVLYIAKLTAQKPERPLVIIDAYIIEKPYAWVFPITTAMHLKTGDIRYAEPGLGPVIVNRRDKLVQSAPSSVPIETYLKQYETTLPKK